MVKWIFTITQTAAKFIEKLSEEDKAKTKNAFLLFEEYGPTLPVKYLKRLSGTTELWELRAKRVRIFFFMSRNTRAIIKSIVIIIVPPKFVMKEATLIIQEELKASTASLNQVSTFRIVP